MNTQISRKSTYLVMILGINNNNESSFIELQSNRRQKPSNHIRCFNSNKVGVSCFVSLDPCLVVKSANKMNQISFEADIKYMVNQDSLF